MGLRRKNIHSKKNTSKTISQLLELTQFLLTEHSEESLFSKIARFLEETQIADHIALFGLKDGSHPLFSQSSADYTWHDVAKTLDCVNESEDISTISFGMGNHILHLEKEKANFSPSELELVRLLRNILQLGFYRDKDTSQSKKSGVLPEENKPSEENKKRNEILKRENLRFSYPKIIGESEALVKLLSVVDKIAETDVPVLIQGESGTGKELIANAIHEYSKRVTFPFLSENCSAIPETLLESELFGYTKGSFTGAYADKKGLFELADKGSLFLDEVGDMSGAMQKKLLRVLQNGELRAVGGKCIKKVDVRLIAATNKNLQEAIKQGTFREDLYYRINVVNMVLPPLRERGKDILTIFDYFVKKYSKAMGIIPPTLDESVPDMLLKHRWPGNIREMENEVKRILALLEGNRILKTHLSPEIVNGRYPSK